MVAVRPIESPAVTAPTATAVPVMLTDPPAVMLPAVIAIGGTVLLVKTVAPPSWAEPPADTWPTSSEVWLVATTLPADWSPPTLIAPGTNSASEPPVRFRIAEVLIDWTKGISKLNALALKTPLVAKLVVGANGLLFVSVPFWR